MAVTTRLMSPGNYSVNFSQEFTPTEIIEAIQEWGHIVITPQQVDVDTLADSDILSAATYTGIVLNRTLEEGVVTVSGQGLELYMGDGAAKGMVIAESNNVGKVRIYTGTTLAETLFNSTAQTNKPLGIMLDEAGNTQAITQGTINNPTGTYTGQHFVETALSALKFICETLDVEYRVNPQGTLDAGPAANLFNGVGTAEPNTIVVKTAYGEDPALEGIVPQGLRTEFDATDWVSRVDFTGEVGFFDTATDVAGEANIASNPYKDLHGNALKRVGLVQEPDIPAASLNDRASTMLNELSRVKKILNLDLTQYEVNGDLSAGDFIYAFDPDIGFVDSSTDATAESRDKYEVTFRGEVINPVKVRVIGLTFPIIDSMGVYFRDKDGNYTDLSEYVQYESGSAQVELGDVIRTIGDDLRFSEYSLSRETAGAFSIPDLPSTPTLQSGTYLNATGDSAGFVRVVVAKPTNIDGSQITDGSHYRVRYKKTTDSQYSYANFPYTGVSSESLLIQDLTVGSTYDVGVAVVDKSGFKKMSAYDGTGEDLYTNSSSVNANFATNARVEIEKDGQAPSKPKAATIAAGPLRVQVTHYLGKDGTDGNGNPFGNFTLEGDVDHLDVHAVTQSGNSASFTIATSNKIGEVRVTSGNILQNIPVIATIELEDSEDYYFRIVAVDKSGNSSDPSDGQTATANLIAEANIADATITTAKIGDAQITTAKIGDAQITSAKVNDLSADKLTSGTITGGEITVGGVSNTSGFIRSYNYSSGSAGFSINSDGSAEFQNATIRGTLNASDITAGTLSASLLDTSFIQVGGGASDINSNSTTIDGGKITANSISASQIQANSITTSELNFTPLSNGDAITSGTVGGISISSSAIQSSDYSSTDGFKIQSDGDAFFNSVDVRVGSAAAESPSTGKTTLDFGSSKVFEFNSDLYLDATDDVIVKDVLRLAETGESASEPSLLFGSSSATAGSSINPVAGITSSLVTASNHGGSVNDLARRLDIVNGSTHVMRFNSVNDQVEIPGDIKLASSSDIYIGNDSGSNGEVLKKENGDIVWGNISQSGTYSTNTSGVTVNNTNSQINFSFGNTNNTFSRGHNHPYASNSHGNHLNSSDVTNNSAVQTGYNHANSSHHSHTGTILTTAFRDNEYTGINTHNDHTNRTNSAHGLSNKANNDYVNSQILAHRFDAPHGNISDERVKDNIVDITLGLDFINRLQPREFTWKPSHLEHYYGYNEDGDAKLEALKAKRKTQESNVTQGFVAQEVKEAIYAEKGSNTAFGGIIFGDYNDYEKSVSEDSDDFGKIDAEKFVPVLVKAVQQLSAKIDVLEARVDELEGA